MSHDREKLWALIAFQVTTARPQSAPEQLADPAKTIGALGCDAIDCVSIALELEDALGIAIPDDVVTCDRTIDDVAVAILPLLAAPEPAGVGRS